MILAADIMSKAPYVESLATKNNVRTGAGTEPLQIRLIGRKSDLLAFLKGHDKAMLRVAADCTRASMRRTGANRVSLRAAMNR